MWTGAALGSVYYTSSTTSIAVSGLFIGVILSLFFGWQINAVIRKIQADEKALEDLATHDALTGLWNRRVFHQTLKKEMKRADDQGHHGAQTKKQKSSTQKDRPAQADEVINRTQMPQLGPKLFGGPG